MGQSLPKAEYTGKRILDIRHGCDDVDEMNDATKNEKIISITTRASRILHGSISWLATGAKLGIGDPIEHWWTIIKTQDENFYMIQFCGALSMIEMRECRSMDECDTCGLREACKTIDASIWTKSQYTGYCQSNKSMADLAKWLKSGEFSSKYSLVFHNCQDLSKAVYKALT